MGELGWGGEYRQAGGHTLSGRTGHGRGRCSERPSPRPRACQRVGPGVQHAVKAGGPFPGWHRRRLPPTSTETPRRRRDCRGAAVIVYRVEFRWNPVPPGGSPPPPSPLPTRCHHKKGPRGAADAAIPPAAALRSADADSPTADPSVSGGGGGGGEGGLRRGHRRSPADGDSPSARTVPEPTPVPDPSPNRPR
eukprot:gene21047-biopygen8614